MKNVADTSIEAFHSIPKESKGEQHKLILKMMRKGRGYTGQALCHMTGLPPNTISARMFELREEKKAVERGEKVVCRYSGKKAYLHRKVA